MDLKLSFSFWLSTIEICKDCNTSHCDKVITNFMISVGWLKCETFTKVCTPYHHQQAILQILVSESLKFPNFLASRVYTQLSILFTIHVNVIIINTVMAIDHITLEISCELQAL